MSNGYGKSCNPSLARYRTGYYKLASQRTYRDRLPTLFRISGNATICQLSVNTEYVYRYKTSFQRETENKVVQASQN